MSIGTMDLPPHIAYKKRAITLDLPVLADTALDRCIVSADLFPSPAISASGLPILEVVRHSAAIYERIDGAGSAYYLASRPIAFATSCSWISFGPIHPVDARVEEGPPVTNGDSNPEVLVCSASLQYKDG